ncbi:MAG TPA: hypothetical protein VGK12_03200 [Actinomycetota bacterium]|jgi:hypothetical protein
MEQGSNIDMSKLSTGEKIVLGGAVAYLVWTFIPVWYHADLGPFGSSNTNGFHGVTLLAWILAVVAVLEIMLRSAMSLEFELPIKSGLLHLGVAGLALLFTLLGLAAKPGGYGISWGIIVALLIALVWAYGAYMMYSEPETMPMSPPGDMQGGMPS